ncbi:MAG: EF-P lysine aminoacylase EpmA [Gammaproteobacteria bacterium]
MTDVSDWRPGADRSILALRAAMLRRLRDWFSDAGVLEVDTPVLSCAGTTDPNIDSLVTSIGGEPYYLHTSPEFPMKRLLASGSGDIYQVCKAFRGGEQGRRHNPEFTMLEWYRVGISLEQMMDDVEALVAELVSTARQSGDSSCRVGALQNATRVSYRDLLLQYAGVDPLTPSKNTLVETLHQQLGAHAIEVPKDLAEDSDALLDMMISLVVEPALDPGIPLFVYDYPVSQAALARIKAGNPPVADRFELIWQGMELANGFRELTDHVEQRRRFESDVAERHALGESSPPIDERLLKALESGMPDCSGVALGLDRLLMAVTGLGDIGSVMAFDLNRA